MKSIRQKIKSFEMYIRNEAPPMLLILNLFGILPILLYPFALYLSIFLFDDPSNPNNIQRYFLPVILYPFVYMANMFLSIWLHKKNIKGGYILPIIAICVNIYLALMIF